MSLRLTATQQHVVEVARELAEREIRPHAATRDERSLFPLQIMKSLAQQGLLGVNVPRAYGGLEAGTVAYALAMREIAQRCAATAVTLAVTNMVAEVLMTFGSETQRQRWVRPLTSGELVAGSFALSEPGAGSDPGAMTTTATPVPGGWQLDGQKQWITSGDHAGVWVVWARTGGPGTKGISCFVVDPCTPGIHVGSPEHKMGIRASSTVPLTFDGCCVGPDHLLGREQEGFKIAMMALDGGRIGIASQACGIAKAALDYTARWVREQHDRTMPDPRPALATSRTELDAAWLLTLRAAARKERGQRCTREAAMAKLYASEMANRVCQRLLPLLGVEGYSRAHPLERYVRDSRVTTIYEGTSEVQRMVIGREVAIRFPSAMSEDS